MSYEHISSKYRAYLSMFSTDIEPKTFEEAVKDQRWLHAMQQEVQALEENGTWKVVPLLAGKNIVGCEWVYKIKYKADGQVDRFKARLVAKGYSQAEGIDYQETFSPMVKMATVRSIIALAAAQKWNIFQMDVFNAFLQGDLLEEVYMELPKGFYNAEKDKHLVCKLMKSLYGLKQASRQWNAKLTEALLSSGYSQSHLDYSLFTKKKGNGIVIVLVYVDDLLLTGNDAELIEETKLTLHSHFKIKDLGELKYFLGIEFMKSNEGIVMNQRKYALELIAEAGLGNAKPYMTPLDCTQKLTSAEFEPDALYEYVSKYQRLVGKLLYLTLTRPDIAFAVQLLSQFMQQPKASHWKAALRVVRYLNWNLEGDCS